MWKIVLQNQYKKTTIDVIIDEKRKKMKVINFTASRHAVFYSPLIALISEGFLEKYEITYNIKNECPFNIKSENSQYRYK